MVDPAYEFLLSSPCAYTPGKDIVEFLFTETFLESMLKEATQYATLAIQQQPERRSKQAGSDR